MKNGFKEEYLDDYLKVSKELLDKKLLIKSENIRRINNFKGVQAKELQEFSATNPTKEALKSFRRNQSNELHEYSILLKKDISLVNQEIKANKNAYLAKVDQDWKAKNVEKVAAEDKPVFEQKFDSTSKKFDAKIDKVANFYDKKIEAIKTDITSLRQASEDLQSEFVDNYKKEENYYQAQQIAVRATKKIDKNKNKIRLMKRKIRELEDVREDQLNLLTAKKTAAQAKIDSKYQTKLDFNRPFSKLFWVNQVLGGVNKSASKFDQQRHMNAIKMGLIYVMPLILVAAFWVFFNNVILNTDNGGFLHLIGVREASQGLKNFKEIGGLVSNITMGLLGVVLAAVIAGTLGRRYKINSLEGAIVGMSAYFAFLPITIFKVGAGTVSAIEYSNLGANSMFLAIFTSLIAMELYNLFLKQRHLKIKMPPQVPPAVARSFNVLIPMFFTTFIFASASFSLLHFSGKNLNELIQLAIQKPLSSGIESAGGVVVIRLIQDVLWILGLHGQNMTGAVLEPIYLAAIDANMHGASNIVTKPFMDGYTLMQDNLLPCIALFLFCKRKDYLSMMSIAFIPALFNISEPVMFGLPIILNPILAIPFVVGSMLMGLFAYLATSLGLAGVMTVNVPWTTPPFIGPWLASGLDIRNLILALFVGAVGVGCYAPFIMLANRQAMKYNPDMIVKRFTFINKGSARNQEVTSYLQELQEKGVLKEHEIKRSPIKNK